jgi:hypothetical protein
LEVAWPLGKLQPGRHLGGVLLCGGRDYPIKLCLLRQCLLQLGLHLGLDELRGRHGGGLLHPLHLGRGGHLEEAAACLCWEELLITDSQRLGQARPWCQWPPGAGPGGLWVGPTLVPRQITHGPRHIRAARAAVPRVDGQPGHRGALRGRGHAWALGRIPRRSPAHQGLGGDPERWGRGRGMLPVPGGQVGLEMGNEHRIPTGAADPYLVGVL